MSVVNFDLFNSDMFHVIVRRPRPKSRRREQNAERHTNSTKRVAKPWGRVRVLSHSPRLFENHDRHSASATRSLGSFLVLMTAGNNWPVCARNTARMIRRKGYATRETRKDEETGREYEGEVFVPALDWMAGLASSECCRF